MCYRTRLVRKREELLERFYAEIDKLEEYIPLDSIDGFAFPKTPVITNEKPRQLQLFNWGLIPEWAKEDSIRSYTLNARIETLDSKKSFKNVLNNRCLVIADGFYEWQWRNKKGTQKQKFLISLPDNELLAFAGIYSRWINSDGVIIDTYSIITTQANDLMRVIHNTKQRMPVILKKEDEQNWLEGEDYKKFAYPYSCKLIGKPVNTNLYLDFKDE